MRSSGTIVYIIIICFSRIGTARYTLLARVGLQQFIAFSSSSGNRDELSEGGCTAQPRGTTPAALRLFSKLENRSVFVKPPNLEELPLQPCRGYQPPERSLR